MGHLVPGVGRFVGIVLPLALFVVLVHQNEGRGQDEADHVLGFSVTAIGTKEEVEEAEAKCDEKIWLEKLGGLLQQEGIRPEEIKQMNLRLQFDASSIMTPRLLVYVTYKYPPQSLAPPDSPPPWSRLKHALYLTIRKMLNETFGRQTQSKALRPLMHTVSLFPPGQGEADVAEVVAGANSEAKKALKASGVRLRDDPDRDMVVVQGRRLSIEVEYGEEQAGIALDVAKWILKECERRGWDAHVF